MRSSPAFAWLVLAATLLLWSGNWIVARAVRDDISPGIATAGRLIVVLLILLPFTFTGLKRKFGQLQGKAVLLAIGFFGGGLHLAFQWLGLHYTTATSATLYLSTAPIFILLLARPLLGERIAPRQWTGVAISFCDNEERAFLRDIEKCRSTRRPPRRLDGSLGRLHRSSPQARRPGHAGVPDGAVCARTVTLLPWVAFEFVQSMQMTLSPHGIVAVLYSAIGSLLLAGAGWAYVVKRIGAARAGVTMHLMPGIAVMLSMLFLDEYPHWYHGAGIALILAGVALSSWRNERIRSK
jgi:drug/metabolite transporter (DMT)-like permease